MSREDAKKILGENATEEQITNLLNTLHANEQALKDQIATKDKQLQQYSDYDQIKNQLDEINKSKMTEQEKLEEARKEIEKNLRESRITKNKAKVMTVLAGLNLDDEIVDSLVGEDENASLDKANKLKTRLDNLREETIKKTTQELTQKNLKPDMNEANDGNNSMTKEKFEKLSYTEQKAFKDANLDTYHNWYNKK